MTCFESLQVHKRIHAHARVFSGNINVNRIVKNGKNLFL